MSKIHWAHPEFGSVIASCSFDRTAKVWEQASANALLDTQQFPNATADGGVSSQPVSRWLERNVMAESKGTVRDVEFAPHYFGLKLVWLYGSESFDLLICSRRPQYLLTTSYASMNVSTNPLSQPGNSSWTSMSSISPQHHPRQHFILLVSIP